MKDVFALIGAIIILFCTLPYIIDVIKKKTKPNIVTWIIWSVLIGIGAAALHASNEVNAALLLTGDFIATFAVVIVGLKYGTAKLDGRSGVYYNLDPITLDVEGENEAHMGIKPEYIISF